MGWGVVGIDVRGKNSFSLSLSLSLSLSVAHFLSLSFTLVFSLTHSLSLSLFLFLADVDARNNDDQTAIDLSHDDDMEELLITLKRLVSANPEDKW
jgi:hypothetical protein